MDIIILNFLIKNCDFPISYVSLPEGIFLGITLVYPHPIAMRIRPQHGDSPQHARAQQGPAAKSYPKAPQDDPGVNLEF